MTLSITNNSAAQLALQNLETTTNQLTQAQTQIDTGLKVGSAQDGSALWAIAQGQRGQISALSAVTAGLNRASSIADVGVNAGQSVSDLLSQIKQTVLNATDPSLTTSSRSSLNSDFQSLLSKITDIVNNSSFDGANVLNGSSTSLQFLTNAAGSQTLSLAGVNLSLGGPLIPLTQTSSINTATNTSSVLSQISTAIDSVNAALSNLGSQATQISAHASFVSTLSDSFNTSIGGLVDADLSKDTSRLQALQVAQQLGVQTVSLANSTPQVILSLFKSA